VPEDAPDDLLLTARIQLQRQDGQATLAALAGIDSAEVMPLKAEALKQAGDFGAAAQIFSEIGDTNAEQSAMGRARQWEGLAARGEEPWKTLAATATAADPQALMEDGPLGKAQKLVEASLFTRGAVTALLASVAKP
jgi:hypothetical protein